MASEYMYCAVSLYIGGIFLKAGIIFRTCSASNDSTFFQNSSSAEGQKGREEFISEYNNNLRFV